jgi:D-arabinitol 2-dehydrogenase
MIHEYPEEHEFDPEDLGHGTFGPDVVVGRHTDRTLASFSMTNKVRFQRIFSSLEDCG